MLGDPCPLLWIWYLRYAVAAVEDYGLLQIPTHRQQLQFTADDHYFATVLCWLIYEILEDHDSRKTATWILKNASEMYFSWSGCNECRIQKGAGSGFRLHGIISMCFRWGPEDMFSNKEELQQFDNAPYVIHYGDRYFKPWFKLPLIPYWWTWRRFKRSLRVERLCAKVTRKSGVHCSQNLLCKNKVWLVQIKNLVCDDNRALAVM